MCVCVCASVCASVCVNKCVYTWVCGRKEGNVLFNDTINTFYILVICFIHMVKDYSDSKRGNPLLPLHGLLFPISSKGSFICISP